MTDYTKERLDTLIDPVAFVDALEGDGIQAVS